MFRRLRIVPYLLLPVVLLGGCALWTNPVAEENPSAYDRQTGDYRELLLDADGWRVWRRTSNYRSTCLAIKPAPGSDWPTLNESLSLPSGGAGFYMIVRDGWERPTLGFYGAHPYDKLSTAELDGVTIDDADDPDRVLGWAGRSVDFRVNTLPSPAAYDEGETQSASLDFTGVETAYRTLQRCHEQRAPGLEPSFRYGGED